jgi:hypothetical protein
MPGVNIYLPYKDINSMKNCSKTAWLNSTVQAGDRVQEKADALLGVGEHRRSTGCRTWMQYWVQKNTDALLGAEEHRCITGCRRTQMHYWVQKNIGALLGAGEHRCSTGCRRT